VRDNRAPCAVPADGPVGRPLQATAKTAQPTTRGILLATEPEIVSAELSRAIYL
jgi:hypothetical protein